MIKTVARMRRFSPFRGSVCVGQASRLCLGWRQSLGAVPRRWMCQPRDQKQHSDQQQKDSSASQKSNSSSGTYFHSSFDEDSRMKDWSDIQLHEHFLKTKDHALMVGEKDSIFLYAGHPLFGKYGFDVGEFIEGSERAADVLVDYIFQRKMNDERSRDAQQIVHEICSADALKTLQELQAEEKGLKEINERIEHDKAWFFRFSGVEMPHDLEISRTLYFRGIPVIEFTIDEKDPSTGENSTGSQENKRIITTIEASFRLSAFAEIVYHIPEPLGYDHKTMDDSQVNFFVTFSGCLSDGKDLEWQVVDIRIEDIHRPFTGWLKRLLRF